LFSLLAIQTLKSDFISEFLNFKNFPFSRISPIKKRLILHGHTLVGLDADLQGNNGIHCQGKKWMSIFIASLDKD
jgi:hypothetical protein